MSIRIGLYDLFAFTLPGAFYLVVVTFGLVSFKFINITLRNEDFIKPRSREGISQGTLGSN